MKKTAKILTNAFALTLCFFACIFAQGRGAPPVPDVSDFAFSRDGQAVVQLFTVPDHDLARRIVQRFREGRIPAYYARVENPIEQHPNEGVFYRIRIRGFDTQREAAEFGHRYLGPLGYSFTTCTMASDALASVRAQTPPPPSEPIITDLSQAEEYAQFYQQIEEFAAEEPRAPRTNRFVFSARPQYLLASEVMSAGHVFEFGAVDSGGLYFSGMLYGGYAYFGGMASLGYCFNQYGRVKNVLGVSGGYLNQLHFIEVVYNGQKIPGIDDYVAQNLAFGGAFWKFMAGRNKYHFDITKSVMFGAKDTPVDYDLDTQKYAYNEKRFNLVFSLTLGYTFMGRSSRKEAGADDEDGGIYPDANAAAANGYANGQEVGL